MTAKKKTPARKPRAANNKTVANKASAADFINAITRPEVKSDSKKIAAMMRRVTGKRATMWGSSIVGFGEYHYIYDSGREGDSMVTGFSPRAQNLSIYIMPGFAKYGALLKKLGKHKTARSCLYIKRLSDVDETVLEALIARSVKDMKARHKTNLK